MKDDVNPRERESYNDCCGGKCGPKENGDFWNNPITRRRFLKKTGGATAATMLALHGMKVEVMAAGAYSSITYLLKTYPAASYSESSIHSFENCEFKLKKWNTPASGIHPTEVLIDLAVEIWEDGAYATNRAQSTKLSCEGYLFNPSVNEIHVEPISGNVMAPVTLKTDSGVDTTLGFYEIWSVIEGNVKVTGYTKHSEHLYVIKGTFGAAVVASERRYASGTVVPIPAAVWAAPVFTPISPIFAISTIP